jgi:hypothetical protein
MSFETSHDHFEKNVQEKYLLIMAFSWELFHAPKKAQNVQNHTAFNIYNTQ